MKIHSKLFYINGQYFSCGKHAHTDLRIWWWWIMVACVCVCVRCLLMDCNTKPSFWLMAKWGGERERRVVNLNQSTFLYAQNTNLFYSCVNRYWRVSCCPNWSINRKVQVSFIFIFRNIHNVGRTLLVCQIDTHNVIDINTIYMSKAKGANAI